MKPSHDAWLAIVLLLGLNAQAERSKLPRRKPRSPQSE